MSVVTGATENRGQNSDLFLEVESTRLGHGRKREGVIGNDSQGYGST